MKKTRLSEINKLASKFLGSEDKDKKALATALTELGQDWARLRILSSEGCSACAIEDAKYTGILQGKEGNGWALFCKACIPEMKKQGWSFDS